MNTTNIACKLIDALCLLAAVRCSYIEFCSNLDTLPFLAGKGCRVQPSIPLSFVEYCSSVVSWLIGGIELIADNCVNSINVKKACSETFTIGPVPCCIHSIHNHFCGLALHS